MNLAGMTLSLDVFFSSGQALDSFNSAMFADTWSQTEASQSPLMFGGAMVNAQQSGVWTPVSCALGTATADHVAIRFGNNSTPWSGTIYYDNVKIQ
jgi:hypothetical protein